MSHLTPGPDHAAPRSIYAFDTSAMKAHIGALLAFLSVIGTFVAAEQAWDWRAFAAAIIAGIVSALTVYHTSNGETRSARSGA